MQFTPYSHRHALAIFETIEPYKGLWAEVRDVLTRVSDEDIISQFELHCQGMKSISGAINSLLCARLAKLGWGPESPIFAEMPYTDPNETRWRLDFAKGEMSIEVAFNHGEAVAWNLLKPVLASELNHVRKAIQTSAGIVITATEAMKKAGGFDGAVGTFEKYVSYLRPLQNQLTVPILIVGLEKPATFEIRHEKRAGKLVGRVDRMAT